MPLCDLDAVVCQKQRYVFERGARVQLLDCERVPQHVRVDVQLVAVALDLRRLVNMFKAAARQPPSEACRFQSRRNTSRSLAESPRTPSSRSSVDTASRATRRSHPAIASRAGSARHQSWRVPSSAQTSGMRASGHALSEGSRSTDRQRGGLIIAPSERKVQTAFWTVLAPGSTATSIRALSTNPQFQSLPL